MSQRSELIRMMHNEGMTFEEIGRALGVSKQAVNYAMHHDGFRLDGVRRVKYVGLKRWLVAHRMNLNQLEKLCGVKLRAIVGEGSMTKSKIDAVLSVTGLSYEACFGIEEESLNVAN